MQGESKRLTDITKENAVYAAVNEFFQCYLTERDADRTLALLAENFYSIGTGEGEIAIGKADFKQLLRTELSQLPPPILYTLTDYTQKELTPDHWECFCNVETRIDLPDGVQAFYRMRVTASLHKAGNHYLFDTFHASTASQYQEEGEFFPLQFISRSAKSINRETQYQLLELIGQIMPGGIIGGYMEDGFPLYVANERLLSMAGYENCEEFEADIHNLIINSVHPDDREYVKAEMAKILAPSDQYEIRYRMKKKDGSYIWVHDIGRRTVAADGRDAVISVLIDVSQQVRTQTSLEHEALSDPLTGIYNRKGAQMRIEETMGSGPAYLFFMLDLDNFKRVNDLYGHQEGDAVLCLVADQLMQTFRKTDIICRLGGDEFAIFIPDCQDMQAIQRKVQKLIDSYYEVAQRHWSLSQSTMSVGGIFSRRMRTFSELYQLADEVLYKVKNREKGHCRLRILN